MADGVQWPYEDAMMEDVFDRLKIKKASWNEVKNYAENYADMYKDEVLQDSLTLEILMNFDAVFYWGDHNITAERARAKLIDWIRKHKEFYNDDPEIMFNRMVEILKVENAKWKAKQRPNAKWTDIPYINWLPGYGGMIRGDRFNVEHQFHKKQLANKYFLKKRKDLHDATFGGSDNNDQFDPDDSD